MSWVESAEASGFDVDNLPYGAFTVPGQAQRRLGVRIGERVLDTSPLAYAGILPGELEAADLGPLLAAGKPRWDEARETLQQLLSDERRRSEVEPHLLSLDQVTMRLPFAVADYVDFYASEHHATNLGRIFRPDGEPLLPNWRHLPVGYHGRSGTVVVSGTSIRRPRGQVLSPTGPMLSPTARLDFELEIGAVVGGSSDLGTPVPIEDAADHIFGLVLINDWSARDIQAWEYQPLGPFLGKSFATSMSPWVVPLTALENARRPGPAQDPRPLPYLVTDEPWGFDIDLEVRLTTSVMRSDGVDAEVITRTNFRHMYWTVAQQLAHMTVNGASIRPGDLFASGTVSGPGSDELGSLIESTWNGERPLSLPGGEERTFLEDGDEVHMVGAAGRVGFGSVVGRVNPPG